jgi:hypothetical protein
MSNQIADQKETLNGKCPYCDKLGPLSICLIFNGGKWPVCEACVVEWYDDFHAFDSRQKLRREHNTEVS